MKSDAFRRAAEAKDFSGEDDLFAADVVFRSPVVYRPYEGREALGLLLRNIVEVLEDFRYVDQVETGDTAVLVFEARSGEKELSGVDILRFDASGHIAEMTVMIRPMSGLITVAEAMGRRLGVGGGGGTEPSP